MSDNTESGATQDDVPALDDAQLEQVAGGTIYIPPDLVNKPGSPPPFVDPAPYEY